MQPFLYQLFFSFSSSIFISSSSSLSTPHPFSYYFYPFYTLYTFYTLLYYLYFITLTLLLPQSTPYPFSYYFYPFYTLYTLLYYLYFITLTLLLPFHSSPFFLLFLSFLHTLHFLHFIILPLLYNPYFTSPPILFFIICVSFSIVSFKLSFLYYVNILTYS